VELACLEFGAFSELDDAIVSWSVRGKFICCLIRENGIGEVSKFFWNRVKPSFLISCEASDSWVIGSSGGRGPDLCDVMVVFK
ncbi:hypothetical protein, partial [Klebsiella variicola]|uniref:hypothetical protein n=1 Tax=Klebsiella variicola TaxID=244366 RepID=UPI0027310417